MKIYNISQKKHDLKSKLRFNYAMLQATKSQNRIVPLDMQPKLFFLVADSPQEIVLRHKQPIQIQSGPLRNAK